MQKESNRLYDGKRDAFIDEFEHATLNGLINEIAPIPILLFPINGLLTRYSS